MMERLVAFENEGEKLYGVLGEAEEPTRDGKGVVLVHGWSGCRAGPHQILVKAARRLNAMGFATLRFDLRGRGDSEGDTLSADLDGMISDSCEAAACLEREAGLSQVSLLGICSGGNVAIGAATLRKDVPVLLLWSVLPFQPQKRTADDIKKTASFAGGYVTKTFRLETWKKLFTGRVNFGLIKRVLFGHYSKPEDEEGRNPKDSGRDIMGELEDFQGAAFFVYGGNDPEAAGAREVYETFCGEQGLTAEFLVIEGSNHSFYSTEWEKQVIEQSAAFLGKHA